MAEIAGLSSEGACVVFFPSLTLLAATQPFKLLPTFLSLFFQETDHETWPLEFKVLLIKDKEIKGKK